MKFFGYRESIALRWIRILSSRLRLQKSTGEFRKGDQVIGIATAANWVIQNSVCVDCEKVTDGLLGLARV